MATHQMSAADATEVIHALEASDVEGVVGGGWGVDALLGRQTRPHADLDIWLAASTFERAVTGLVAVGVDRLFPWGDERPWNFVLHDGATRRVDLHLYEILTDGSVHYGGVATGETFSSAAFAGRGAISDRMVRCESPEWSLKWHTGYPPRSLWRARAALSKGVVQLVFGLVVLGQAAWRAVDGTPPVADAMALMGLVALAGNTWAFTLLWRHRSDDINMTSTWLCSRNDLIANAAVLAAAAAVWQLDSVWPDVIVGIAISVLFLRTAFDVIRDARAELATADEEPQHVTA